MKTSKTNETNKLSTKPTFTPGPWTVSIDTMLLSIPGHAEADISEVGEANAKLIGAAPDLLEALEIVLVQLGEYKDSDGAAKFHTIIIAKDALKKARGENT